MWSKRSLTAAFVMLFALAAAAHAQPAAPALADRIQSGDRRAALAMIAEGADVNRAQPDGTTPLHWAAYRVDRELVVALLKKGARAQVVNRYGASPLAEAVKVANAEIVGMLLEAGADANVANEDGQTALMLAARTGDVAVAKLLVQHGADINRRERFKDQSAVMWAAGESHAEMVAFLVSKGADLSVRARVNDWETQITNEPRVQYRPTGGLTPLLYAARSGCLGCVKAMLDAGADKDRPNPDGMTPMIMALDNGHPGVARYLLEQGSNPHTWDWWGRTPLYVAVTMRGGQDSRAGSRTPESLLFINALLDAGVNPNPQLAFKEPSRGGRDNRFRDDLLTTGATPLIRAAQTFDNDVVRALLAHGALVDLPNASGVTPFMAAAGIGTRTISGVLGAGPPENVVALSLATMEILRQAGADVNARVTDTTSLTARIARAEHVDRSSGSDHALLCGRVRTNGCREVPARSRREGGRRGRHRQDADRYRRGKPRRRGRGAYQGNRDPATDCRDDRELIPGVDGGLGAPFFLSNSVDQLR